MNLGCYLDALRSILATFLAGAADGWIFFLVLELPTVLLFLADRSTSNFYTYTLTVGFVVSKVIFGAISTFFFLVNYQSGVVITLTSLEFSTIIVGADFSS